MASKRIRGITIDIDGNTTKLSKALEDSEESQASDSLRDIEKALRFNPGNTKLVEQQQEICKLHLMKPRTN